MPADDTLPRRQDDDPPARDPGTIPPAVSLTCHRGRHPDCRAALWCEYPCHHAGEPAAAVSRPKPKRRSRRA